MKLNSGSLYFRDKDTGTLKEIPLLTSSVKVDTTLTESGQAADAKTVGNKLNNMITLDDIFTTSSNGLVPASTGTDKYLRGDGTWQTPPSSSSSVMTGATSSAAGTSGLVPAPSAGYNTNFLRGDGTWSAITSSQVTSALGYTPASSSSVPSSNYLYTLWTNSSPTSEFASQTVSISASSYTLFIVAYFIGTSSSYNEQTLAYTLTMKGSTYYSNLIMVSNTSTNRTGRRPFYITSSSAYFGDMTYNGGTSNTLAIPYKIYGISGIS